MRIDRAITIICVYATFIILHKTNMSYYSITCFELSPPSHPHLMIATEPVLSFSSNRAPDAKKFSIGKVVSVIRKVGNVAGKVADVAGKVAVVASIL